MRPDLPLPSIERLCALYEILERLEREGSRRVSSAGLGTMTGESAATVRKDIARLGAPTAGGAGYDTVRLREAIGSRLGITAPRSACIVGLGRMGQAILQYTDFASQGIEIRAGFDSDVNKLELLSTTVPLYPSYRIPEIVRSRGIGLAVLAVPPESAQGAAERLVEGGISGIVNFSSPVAVPPEIHVRQISVLDELRILSALADENP